MTNLLWWIIVIAILVVIFAALGFWALAGVAAWVLRILFIMLVIVLIVMLIRNFTARG